MFYHLKHQLQQQRCDCNSTFSAKTKTYADENETYAKTTC